MKSWIVLALLSGIGGFALAAPHPGSTLVAPKIGLFRSPLGFQINEAQSGWKVSSPAKDSKFVATVFKAPNSKTGALTVRVDPLERDVSLDVYMQRWIKEYPRFGFDILGSKPFLQNQRRGYVVDLLNKESKKQMRQVVFLSPKKKSAVILTCRDHQSSFNDSLKSCNSIIRTFDWKD